MTTPFADPSAPGGDKLPLPELNKALLVIEVTEALRNVSTAFGDSDPAVETIIPEANCGRPNMPTNVDTPVHDNDAVGE